MYHQQFRRWTIHLSGLFVASARVEPKPSGFSSTGLQDSSIFFLLPHCRKLEIIFTQHLLEAGSDFISRSLSYSGKPLCIQRRSIEIQVSHALVSSSKPLRNALNGTIKCQSKEVYYPSGASPLAVDV